MSPPPDAQPTADSSRLWLGTLVACTALVALGAGLAPLADPDLPHHLSMGEWILANGRVPFVEPFAWTRAGAPYFAYSWLMEVLMFATLRVGGPTLLHLLAGVLIVATAIAGALAARALGARPSGATAFGVASALLALESTPFLRPQLAMHLLVPLAWLLVARLRGRRYESPLLLTALLLVSAIAANVHITFPVVALPLALVLADERPLRAPGPWWCVGAVVGGWLLSPYGSSWLGVFRLNFAHNAMTATPVSGELAPGFVVAPLIGLALAALPLVALPRIAARRERIMLGLLWLAGLVLFAVMFKGIGPWWWCATPLTVAALGRVPHASTPATRRTLASLLVAFMAALAIPAIRLRGPMSAYEGDVRNRVLPSLKGFAIEPVASWVERNTRAGAQGRVLTAFNYGSYLEWRLPGLSASVDGRTIFPDSAAFPDVPDRRREGHAGPWRSADLAIVPMTYPSARLLDADTAWMRIGVAIPAPWAPHGPRAGLWVRRRWLAVEGKGSADMPADGVLR